MDPPSASEKQSATKVSENDTGSIGMVACRVQIRRDTDWAKHIGDLSA